MRLADKVCETAKPYIAKLERETSESESSSLAWACVHALSKYYTGFCGMNRTALSRSMEFEDAVSILKIALYISIRQCPLSKVNTLCYVSNLRFKSMLKDTYTCRSIAIPHNTLYKYKKGELSPNYQNSLQFLFDSDSNNFDSVYVDTIYPDSLSIDTKLDWNAYASELESFVSTFSEREQVLIRHWLKHGSLSRSFIQTTTYNRTNAFKVILAFKYKVSQHFNLSTRWITG